MDDEKVPIGQLDTDYLEGDSVAVRPEEYDQVLVVRIRRVERTNAVLNDMARPLAGDSVLKG